MSIQAAGLYGGFFYTKKHAVLIANLAHNKIRSFGCFRTIIFFIHY